MAVVQYCPRLSIGNYLLLWQGNLHISLGEEPANDKDLARLRDAVRSSAANLFASGPHALG